MKELLFIFYLATVGTSALAQRGTIGLKCTKDERSDPCVVSGLKSNDQNNHRAFFNPSLEISANGQTASLNLNSPAAEYGSPTNSEGYDNRPMDPKSLFVSSKENKHKIALKSCGNRAFAFANPGKNWYIASVDFTHTSHKQCHSRKFECTNADGAVSTKTCTTGKYFTMSLYGECCTDYINSIKLAIKPGHCARGFGFGNSDGGKRTETCRQCSKGYSSVGGKDAMCTSLKKKPEATESKLVKKPATEPSMSWMKDIFNKEKAAHVKKPATAKPMLLSKKPATAKPTLPPKKPATAAKPTLPQASPLKKLATQLLPKKPALRPWSFAPPKKYVTNRRLASQFKPKFNLIDPTASTGTHGPTGLGVLSTTTGGQGKPGSAVPKASGTTGSATGSATGPQIPTTTGPTGAKRIPAEATQATGATGLIGVGGKTMTGPTGAIGKTTTAPPSPRDIAEKAVAIASNASKTAKTASITAKTAQSDVSTAKGAAENAEKAVAIASNATKAAQNAQSKAKNAEETANSADNTANTVRELGEKTKGITDIVTQSALMSPTLRAHLKREAVEWDVQNQYNRLEALKKKVDSDVEVDSCERRRNKTVVVFPALPLTGDGSDPIDCLTMNRDHIVQAFCDFRKQFDDTLKSHNLLDEKSFSGRALWPKMCCAGQGDCNRTNINATEMRPFVMAQGGTLTLDSMRSEIFDMLGRKKVDQGILLEGMNNALNKLNKMVNNYTSDKVKTLRKEMKSVFQSISVCGPIVFESPDHEENTMCEMFYAYHHLFTSFLLQVKKLLLLDPYVKKLPLHRNQGRRLLAWKRNLVQKSLRYEPPTSSSPEPPKTWKAWMKQQFFVYDETIHHIQREIARVQSSNPLGSRQMNLNTAPTAKKVTGLIGEVEELKREIKQLRADHAEVAGLKDQINFLSPSRNSSCLAKIDGLRFGSSEELKKYQGAFCEEYGLDLASSEAVNVAMVYTRDKFLRDPENDDGPSDESFRLRLQQNIRYSVTDQCKYDKMFRPRDISLQKVRSPENPEGSEWAFLIKLDSANEKGYLSSQLQNQKGDNQCRNLNYLPHTEIGIQAYEDTKQCCTDSMDYWKCIEKKCELTPLKHHWKMANGQEEAMAFKMSVTGTVFNWKHYAFLVEGTQNTNRFTKNTLTLGENMNGGNDGSQIKQMIGSNFLEVGLTLSEKSKYYEEFMKSAVASDASVEAAEFFKGVTVDKSSGKLSFLCTNAPTLCARLTQQSHRQDALEFKHGDSSIFRLEGDGQFAYYNFCHNGEGDGCSDRRRRLLQRSSRPC